MTESFIENLSEILIGSVAFLGIGNVDRSDDGAGMALAQKLSGAGIPNVFLGGLTPEKHLPSIREDGYDTVALLDAANVGATPGSIAIFDAQEIKSRFPIVSTHKLSAGMLAQLITDGNSAKVWLIGIQPETLAMGGAGLSSIVEKTVTYAAHSIVKLMALPVVRPQEQVCI
jgi:hydrogenase maturation protease